MKIWQDSVVMGRNSTKRRIIIRCKKECYQVFKRLSILGKMLSALTVFSLVLAILGVCGVLYLQGAGDTWVQQGGSTEAINQLFSDISTRLIVTLLFVALFAYGVGIWVAKRIAESFVQIADSVELISKGELYKNIKQNNDFQKVDTLGESLGLMVGNLSNALTEIAGSSKRISLSSQELNTGIDQITKSAEQIAATAQHVAIGSEGQVKSVEEVTSAINQMSIGVQQIASNAQSVSTSAEQATKYADFGRDAIDNAISQMESIRRTVDGSAEVIRELGHKSQAIGNIVDLIRNIADQTNLLALNAAIEAARAGEQGRGFAVVADEVRKLAEQSASATKEISDLITAVKEETSRAVRSMDLGTKEAAQGTVVVSDAGNAFLDIRKAVEGVSKQINEVSNAAQEMASGSSQVVKSVETIAFIAQETSGQTQNVAAAAEEQTASMEEIRHWVNSLSNMSIQLDNIVKKFHWIES
jgi:methyl-accepting chemotaxis protein